MKTYRNYTILTFIIGILAIIAHYFVKIPIIQLTTGLIFLILIGYGFGRVFFKQAQIIEKTILGFLIAVFIIIIIGALFFYLYAMNNLFFVFTTLGLPILLFAISRRPTPTTPPTPPVRGGTLASLRLADGVVVPPLTGGVGGVVGVIRSSKLFLIPIFLTLTATLFYILATNSTTHAINTPWQVLPTYFFVLFFINTLALIAILLSNSGQAPACPKSSINYKLILISIYLFLTLSIAYFIYQLGYGFDPFIHRATLKIISQTGTISPKPFYYIGQYSLIFYLSKIFGLSLNFLDKILVPLLAALFLPAVLCFYVETRQCLVSTRQRWLIIISVFLIPFSFLIATTPQNLANLFFIILIILSFSWLHSPFRAVEPFCLWSRNAFIILNAIAIFFIHPLAGIPAIFFILIYLLIAGKPQLARTLRASWGLPAIIIIALISFPAVWLINSQISSIANVNVSSEIFSNLTNYLQNMKLLTSARNGQFKIILNTVYFFYFNLTLILSLVLIFSLKKVKQAKQLKYYAPYLICFIIFFFNYLILKIFFNFGFLINYERENYTTRVLQLSYFFLIPFLLFFLNYFWQKIAAKNFWIKYVSLILLAGGLTMSLYLIYPRHDNFTASHGYNTSEYDIAAVNYINQNSNNNFIVLANQQVAAAALQEFGFKKYYQIDQGKIFYYPIPTGGSLYKYYLEMTNKKPTREIMLEAMNLVGVNEGYLVINKYWWNFGRIVDWASLYADEYKVIGDGDVYVFKFVKLTKGF